MKYLAGLLLLSALPLFAQNAESDLQKPVSDLGKIQREEWEKIPTIEEVLIKNAPQEKRMRKQQREEEKPSRKIRPLRQEE